MSSRQLFQLPQRELMPRGDHPSSRVGGSFRVAQHLRPSSLQPPMTQELGRLCRRLVAGLLWALSSGLNQCQTCTEEKKPENSGWGLGTVARKHPRGYTPLLHGKGDHTQSAHWPLAHPAGSDDAAASTQDPRRPTGCQGSSEDRESLGGCWGQTQPEEHAAGLTVKPVHPVSVGGHLEISFPNQQMAGPGRGGSAL